MRLRWIDDRVTARLGRAVLWAVVLTAGVILGAASLRAEPPASTGAATATATGDMSSSGWAERVAMALEGEAMSDVSMLPDTGNALAREWRSFDRNGSAVGALANLGWVALAACIALLAERAVARGLSRRLRRVMRAHFEGLTLSRLFLLLACDLVGVAVFAATLIYSRHWLTAVGVTGTLIGLAGDWLVRWRLVTLIPRIVLRPNEPVARLIDVDDDEARRLSRFLSVVVLAIVVFVGFGRYSLHDEDSGAPHIIGLGIALIVCGLNTLIVLRSRGAAEALIRGCGTGIVAAARAGIARAWQAIGLTIVAGLFVFFVFGLSLGILPYFHAFVSTLGVLLVLLVLERLTERGWHEGPISAGDGRSVDRLVARGFRRVLHASVLVAAVLTLVSIWIDALELPRADAARSFNMTFGAVATLFVAYVVWELIRLGIDRHLQDVAGGPRLPGSDDDDETSPGSRLQTILPMLRAAFGILIAVVVALIVLSRLGIDTAPLIAGAGVFGLAISFGAQSLVRDVISGLFYLWDDAFRVGEYIDTGRLKGTIEALGIRSVKVRHHNGPLHTIPYGQLGAVTNQSRDFATIKFNLRLESGTDVELVRKTAKRIGQDMQENPEIAAEVMVPLKLQGIAEVVDTAVVMRFKFTARPVKPSWVQREYLKAMYRVFAEKGIRFASGALTLTTAPPREILGGISDGEAVPPPVLAEAGAPRSAAPARVA